MLDRMEQSSLLTRTYDKADRRQIRISLTEQARLLSGEYTKVSQAMNEIYYSGFTDDEIIAFENNLRRILENLDESEKGLMR
jgi:DNA-binding MarR family transcriptional regulator